MLIEVSDKIDYLDYYVFPHADGITQDVTHFMHSTM